MTYLVASAIAFTLFSGILWTSTSMAAGGWTRKATVTLLVLFVLYFGALALAIIGLGRVT